MTIDSKLYMKIMPWSFSQKQHLDRFATANQFPGSLTRQFSFLNTNFEKKLSESNTQRQVSNLLL